MRFDNYIKKFELEVVEKGVNAGVLGKPLLVNVRNGKFSRNKFARQMGDRIESTTSYVLDYYGYLKKSEGFLSEVEGKKQQLKGRQIKSVQATVVFFAAIKIEEICKITSSEYLRANFSEFKNTILKSRGFV